MSYVAKKSRNELYRTNTCGVSHHRATPAVCSESFRSKETEAFPEHQDSLYVLCIHTNTHTHTLTNCCSFDRWFYFFQALYDQKNTQKKIISLYNCQRVS